MIEADCEYDVVIVTMSRDEAAALLATVPQWGAAAIALRAALTHAIDEEPEPT